MTTPPDSLNIVDNQEDSLTVSAKDVAGFPTPDGPFTWAVDNTAVATVSDNGDGTAEVVAVSPGSANVSATDPTGVTQSLAVDVSTGPANSLQIVAGTPTDQPPPAGQ